jgi:AAA+ superfamily predicted ATPase
MNATNPNDAWVHANQHLLVTEFARIRARLAGDDTAAAADGVHEARAAMPEPSAIDRLTDYFGLSTFERDVVLLCAGVEMDSNLASLCAVRQDSTQRPQATFGLALATLEEPHWSALSPVRPLRRWRLAETADDTSPANARLRLDERVLHFLAGINYLDTRLQPLLRVYGDAAAMTDTHGDTVDTVLEFLRERQASLPVVHLQGDDRDGQADIAARIAATLGLQLHVLRAEDIPADANERDAFAVLWQREAALLSSALLVECSDHAHAVGVTRLAERLGGLLFVASREPLESQGDSLRFTVDRPGARDQRWLWEAALGPAARKLNGSLDGVASQYRLSAQTILSTGASIRTAITSSDAPDEVLWRACRTLGRRHLDELAQRIEPASRWDELVLPEHQKAILRQVASYVRNRLKVCEDWGFAGKNTRGLGLSTLFAGESGTGKTMAAEVLANELNLDLYRIDLSSVVSKYIGETEKNLRKVFDAAESSGAILLFDEADALFGKRSEVKDSHDRYANIEVSYLLQRMEAYTGLAILTTNQKAALDPAFQRRLRFVVQFAFPDAAQREAIWRSIFPAATPTDGLNYGRLAQLQVAGGNIHNIALNAAYLAAEAGEPVSMAHLLRAAHSESAKRERPLNEAEIRGWV